MTWQRVTSGPFGLQAPGLAILNQTLRLSLVRWLIAYQSGEEGVNVNSMTDYSTVTRSQEGCAEMNILFCGNFQMLCYMVHDLQGCGHW